MKYNFFEKILEIIIDVCPDVVEVHFEKHKNNKDWKICVVCDELGEYER